MTLSKFQDGFSMIPIPCMLTIAEDFEYGMGVEMVDVYPLLNFRDFSDKLATLVYHHPRRKDLVMKVWWHCFTDKKPVYI